ncbi:MAG: RluA family pseudouridine synthase [Nanoarchaeota archaeon]|nr:RluA family pseudouridine synthase [Nanoarchaeota archaeon]
MLELTPKKENRLDRYIMDIFSSATLSEIYKWIRTGKIKVNRKKQKTDYKLKKTDKIQIFLSEAQIEDYKKKGVIHKKSFEVLYEDDDILIVNKPPNLASQGGVGVSENNLVNQVRYYLKNKNTIALANRLDKGTSGIVIFGKNPEINSKLYELTKKRKIEKYYYALAVGKITKNKGILNDYTKRAIRNYQERIVSADKNDPKARYTETEYEVKFYYRGYTLLKLKLNTGRMHQIRVQCALRKHPILGDKTYGNQKENTLWSRYIKRQFLHASHIKFTHPITNKTISVEAPFPKDIKRILAKLR